MMRSSADADDAHGRDDGALAFADVLMLQDLQHAEHAVHRRADFVAHGGEEGGFRLVCCFGLEPRRFGRIALARQIGLALLQFGDVAHHDEPAAVWHLAEAALDPGSVRTRTHLLVAVSAVEQLHLCRDVLVGGGRGARHKAVLVLIAPDVLHGAKLEDLLARDVHQLEHRLVGGDVGAVCFGRPHAVAHVVEECLHVGTRALGLGAGGLKFHLALLDVGYVGGGADQAMRSAIRAAQRDAVLPHPAPGTVGATITIFVFETRCLAFEMCGESGAEAREVVGMHDLGPTFARLCQFRP